MKTVNADFSRKNNKTNSIFDYMMMWLFERVETGYPNRKVNFVTWTSKDDKNHFFYKHMLIRIKPFQNIRGIAIRSDVKLPLQQTS